MTGQKIELNQDTEAFLAEIKDMGEISSQTEIVSENNYKTAKRGDMTEPKRSFIDTLDYIRQNGVTSLTDIYKNILINSDKSAIATVSRMGPAERAFFKAGAIGLSPADAARQAEGMHIDQDRAWNAWEKGNQEYTDGNGEATELLIEATDYLDSTGESGIMNAEYGVGELAKLYSSDLIPNEINGYIKQMLNYGSYIEVDNALDFYDISLMSRQTGTEFASVTIGDKHYLIKGDEKGTPISTEMLEEMRKYGGTLNCHSHPYVGDLKVSESDLRLAKEMYWQEEFYVISPDGQYAVYNKYGIIEVKTVSKVVADEDLAFYEELFKE